MKNFWTISMASVSASAMLAPALANAQDAAPQEQADAGAQAGTPANDAIIVTGTRITTGGFHRPLPSTS